MSGTGLVGVINGTFVNRLVGLSSSASSSSVTSAAGASGDSIASGLRLGAQTYATALTGLNTTIDAVNLSQATLIQLRKLTDKLITVATESSEAGTSNTQRSALDVQFKKLGNRFRQVVESAELGGASLLTSDGLADLFSRIGLDREASKGVAALFEKFGLTSDDPSLASEESKGTRPVSIPPGAFLARRSDSPFRLTRISNSTIPDGSAITAVSNVINDTDTYLNQNPAYKSVLIGDNSGSFIGVGAGVLTGDVTVKAVNEVTGYSVIESTQDFLGYNGGGAKQLFLVDSSGNIVHQFTNESSAQTFDSVDLSSDDQTIIIGSTDIGLSQSTVRTITAGALGEDPAASSASVIETNAGVGLYTQTKINNEGTYVAYYASGAISLRDVATLTADATLSVVPGEDLEFGFTKANQLTILRDAGGGLSDIATHTYNVAGYTNVVSGVAIGEFTALQDTDGGNGYFAYENTAARTVTVESTAAAVFSTLTYTASDTINNLTLARKAAGDIDVGIDGTLVSYGGYSTRELYRYSSNPQYMTGARIGRTGDDFDEIFDSEQHISKRSDAYRVLSDLKALRAQIVENIKVLDTARELIGKNIDLVRAAGLAFLELSDQISSADDADKVAIKLRTAIRAKAPAALSQAENLEAITVAGLALNAASTATSTSSSSSSVVA